MSRKSEGIWFPLYCDETCIEIRMTGCWTKTKKGKVFCQRHAAMVSVCSVCGKKFHSTRGHTETCSGKCRTAKSRAKSIQIESVTSEGLP